VRASLTRNWNQLIYISPLKASVLWGYQITVVDRALPAVRTTPGNNLCVEAEFWHVSKNVSWYNGAVPPALRRCWFDSYISILDQAITCLADLYSLVEWYICGSIDEMNYLCRQSWCHLLEPPNDVSTVVNDNISPEDRVRLIFEYQNRVKHLSDRFGLQIRGLRSSNENYSFSPENRVYLIFKGSKSGQTSIRRIRPADQRGVDQVARMTAASN
jgi:hypothetical protein